jgi:VWFA-related protein
MPAFHLLLLVLVSAAGSPPGMAQAGPAQTTPPSTAVPTAPAQPPIDNNAPEMATKEAPALFKTRVNLVRVPVVVRDSKGRAIGTFTKDNFQLFDKGKPQAITVFSVEKSGSVAAKEARTADTVPAAAAGESAPLPDVPERFVAYLFDDTHLRSSDLMRVRDAAGRQLAGLQKTDRAAICTTSGQDQLDFTDDADKLHQTLLRLRSRSTQDPGGVASCPDISYYMADMMVNKEDPAALNAATQEVLACEPSSPDPGREARYAAMRVLARGTEETHLSLTVLRDLIRRMSAMPGQRIIVMVSPGFYAPEAQEDKSDVLDRAIHANVLINSLDARGLWTDPSLDASNPGRAASPIFASAKQQYDRASASAEADVLAEMAYGTGGTFFENSNDLDAGFRQLVAAPEYYYILGFSPQNLKVDGSFHSLKVSFKPPATAGLGIQARKGYYAPKKLTSAEDTAKQEIEEALFSRDELSEMPLELKTRFFKSSDKDATLTVMCGLDPKGIRFRKAGGRNINSLTIVSALFDRNGNFVSGVEKVVDLKLKDETLAKLLARGAWSVATNFSVAPGTYMVRLVVRDSEGQLMAAANGAVAIE